MSEGLPIRRLRLVREAGEPRVGGTAAVRRYRLARLEQVAETSRTLAERAAEERARRGGREAASG